MIKGFVSPFALKKSGILGMNSRNIEFVSRYNDRKLYSRVDNKLQTKELAEEFGINTPKLLFVVRMQHDIAELEAKLAQISSFAIKPARGSGGKGILIIKRTEGEHYIKGSGAQLHFDGIARHLTNILAGLYSLRGDPDVAIVEALIESDPIFDAYSYQGVPDIRIIVFQGYPIMAMLRLSTKESDGKANLHQGAVGVGIDISSGRAIHAVMHGKRVHLHPDTNHELEDIVIPNWRELLIMASSCYELSSLGYLGVDIVLDKNRGAMLLELNARPGLSIQVANSCGLLWRLRAVEELETKSRHADKRVNFSMDHFKI